MDKNIDKIYLDMWIDLLKRLSLDEKYLHPMMEGLVGLLRVVGTVCRV